MPNLALITGASSGIGREFARYHASLGGDLAITARRSSQLEALKTELEATHGVAVHVFPMDLGAPGAAQTLVDSVAAAGLTVDILINNAGFGGHGLHIERDLADEHAMIDLNIKALVTLSHRYGADMAKRGGGKIMNVSSTASYMPGPLQAVYFATKAYVSNYSAALHEELRDKGVTVTALEPGFVKTEFAATANLEGTNLVKGGATAPDVAKIGYDAMVAGKLYVINDKSLAFQVRWLMPFLPTKAKLKLVRKMQEKAA